METKKNSKFDLESKRRIFFFYGLIIALTSVLLSFKGGSEVAEIYIPESPTKVIVDVIDIPRTEVSKPLIAPPPLLKIFDEVKIVENHAYVPPVDFGFDDLYDPMPLPNTPEPPVVEEGPLDFAEIMPEFPGGNKNLNKWLSRNLNYPESAQNIGLKGRVYLRFVVDKDGSISNVNVTRGVDTLLDEEAKRVIKAMPNWKPGMQNGTPVAVSFNIFVSFQLN